MPGALDLGLSVVLFVVSDPPGHLLFWAQFPISILTLGKTSEAPFPSVNLVYVNIYV